MRWFLIALLLAGPVRAEGLKLATWNLEWLTARAAGDPALPADVRPKSVEDVARLARYAAYLDADVVALQEVDGPGIAAKVFPPAKYVLHFTGDRVVQRTGFAVRRSIAFGANPDVVAIEAGNAALRSGADITLTASHLRLLNVHLKTGCREDRLGSSARAQCETLRQQLPAVQGWIAQRRAEGAPFVVMGDFNRWMEGGDAFWAGLLRTAPMVRATEGKRSPCWGGGGFIDHIIAGGAARGWMDPGTLAVLTYNERGPEWKERLSDHCPVSVNLRLP
jgi:endonuclease/exonuclease/phosphatase family metal-dependent hydrolase